MAGAETLVTRKDIFGESTESVDDGARIYGGYEFEEVDVGAVPQDAIDTEDVEMEFQLFGGDGIATVNLAAKHEDVPQGRPVAYYIYNPSDEDQRSFQTAAVSGKSVLDEADFWRSIASKRPIAPDINKDWTPKKRPCRPGKSARLNKKARNQRVEQESKERRERFKRQRSAFKFKPGGKPRPRGGKTN